MTQPVVLDIEEVIGSFPSFRVALVVAEAPTIATARTPTLEAVIADIEAQATRDLGSVELADIPELKCWREAYKAFCVKKTSYRSSIERLVKAVQRGGGLPRVNALVDAYNALSLRYRLPVGADDIDRVVSPLAFRYARPDDSFIALGDASQAADPPKPGEVVYADAEKCLCRRWNWYQDDRSAVRLESRRAVLTVQGLEPASAARVEEAAAELCELIASHCGGSAAWAVAEAGKPLVELGVG
jgi:DNA/RNA-binding domain of Phe-tRNA-synthetase-like protein